MHCPTLAELPAPPADRTGWPWTEESPRLPDAMRDGKPWPRVSIVTPSFNQAQFIEETIRSVLLQGYPDLEYIIIDGGSTDGSVDIIRKYEPWLAYWVSEKDSGQSEAINKGFARATGEIVAWINSDDVYEPDALASCVPVLMQNPRAALVYGACNLVDDAGKLLSTYRAVPCTPRDLLLDDNHIAQPSVFMRTEALQAAGGVDADLRYTMDYALWVRLGLMGELQPLSVTVSNFRLHPRSKSGSDGYRFKIEQLHWLDRWLPILNVLSVSDAAEALRRMHVRTAIEYAFAGEVASAAEHFSLAMGDGVRPFGSTDALASCIVGATALDGMTVYECKDAFGHILHALDRMLPHAVARPLRRIVESYWHMKHVFDGSQRGEPQTIGHLLRGVYHDPRWLRNRGVWSVGLETVLGETVIRWVRRR